jgi:hypothetical protein
MGRFQNNPSIRWLHPKSTHAHPLAWANKKFTRKPITLSIQSTFDSSTPISVQKVFPQHLCKTKPTNIESISSCHHGKFDVIHLIIKKHSIIISLFHSFHQPTYMHMKKQINMCPFIIEVS